MAQRVHAHRPTSGGVSTSHYLLEITMLLCVCVNVHMQLCIYVLCAWGQVRMCMRACMYVFTCGNVMVPQVMQEYPVFPTGTSITSQHYSAYNVPSEAERLRGGRENKVSVKISS